MAKATAEVEELPKAIVRRVVKDKLSQTSNGGEISVQKDALLAFSESARIFIHYISATANDICKESKRQTINADDVLKALEEIEFPEFIEPLKASLDDLGDPQGVCSLQLPVSRDCVALGIPKTPNYFRRKNAGKKAGAAKAREADKKRKLEEEATARNGDGEGDGVDLEEANEDEDEDEDDDTHND